VNRLIRRFGGDKPSERLGHRPGLDGLRGLAVLLVLAQHLGLPVFRGGGLVGVLLFFVLSGFLITWLLLDERAATGRIDIRAFYARRARRLLPAFVAMLAVVVGVAALVGNLGGIAGPALVAGAYVANWSHLFDIDMGPLNHTWSLSVEEQFYIVWPAVLIGFFAFRRLGWVILAACVAAVLWFMPMTGGAIAFGALLGVLVRGNLVPATPTAVGWTAVAGLVALSAVVGTGWTTPTWAKLAILAPAGLGAIWAAQSPKLGWKPMAGIGLISYGLYLWHVPIVWALQPFLAQHLPWPMVTATLAVLSFAAAGASWRFIEVPMRTARRRPAAGLETVEPERVSGLPWTEVESGAVPVQGASIPMVTPRHAGP
jgi:peptidoglycan/LPS O-acetylase OafA/YrhL